MALSTRIVELRENRLGLTQRELGKAVGVDAISVSRWERGVVEPRPKHLRALAAVGNVPVAWFYEDAA